MEYNINDILTYLMPAMSFIIAGIIGLWVKDNISSLSAGIRWKMKPGFEPGDEVFLDGERATIVSIGYTQTIFQIDNGRGTVWRYIPNTRIDYVRLERIIKPAK